jgi:hypothetical protein
MMHHAVVNGGIGQGQKREALPGQAEAASGRGGKAAPPGRATPTNTVSGGPMRLAQACCAGGGPRAAARVAGPGLGGPGAAGREAGSGLGGGGGYALRQMVAATERKELRRAEARRDEARCG